MPLETVKIALLDSPFWEPVAKTIRNIDIRLRLHEDVLSADVETIKLWEKFFEVWSKGVTLDSDRLLALAQIMFEIEEHKKILDVYKEHKPVYQAQANLEAAVTALVQAKIDPEIVDLMLTGTKDTPWKGHTAEHVVEVVKAVEKHGKGAGGKANMTVEFLKSSFLQSILQGEHNGLGSLFDDKA